MKKFGQILALVFVLAFGYGLGQHTQDLFATDYPTGGAGGGTHPVNLATDVTGELPHGSTSDDAAQVHGLGANVNVLGNRDASGEFIERGSDTELQTATTVTYEIGDESTTVTFATAFSGTPRAFVTENTNDQVTVSLDTVTTTTFIWRPIGNLPTGSTSYTIDFLAIGA